MILETIKKISTIKGLNETKKIIDKETKVLELRKLLGNPISAEMLSEYNIDLTVSSKSDFKEINLKRYLLRTRGEIFSKEEYIKWNNYIRELSVGEMKENIKEQIITPFDTLTLKKYNDGFLSRNCDLIKTPLPELEIKRILIYGNADIFTTDEINELLEVINHSNKKHL